MQASRPMALRPPRRFEFTSAAVAQFVSLEHLQHYLALMEAVDAVSLAEDAYLEQLGLSPDGAHAIILAGEEPQEVEVEMVRYGVQSDGIRVVSIIPREPPEGRAAAELMQELYGAMEIDEFDALVPALPGNDGVPHAPGSERDEGEVFPGIPGPVG